MDEEAKQLLRKILDVLQETSARDAAWFAEMRENVRRNRNVVRWVLIPLLILAAITTAWVMLPTAQ